MKFYTVFFLIITGFITSCQSHEHHQHDESVFMITKPIVQDTIIYHEYVSQIRSIQHIELRALEKGYLQNIYVDEGQLVKKGELLFQIMPLVYQAEAGKAKAEVSYAEIEYKNTKALADSNIVSKNELALASARLEKARAEYDLAMAHLNFTEIRAPFDGIVGRFNDVRLGSLVDEGDLLTTLSDNNKMWVYFNVPEAEYLDYATKPKNGEYERVKLQLANNAFFEHEGIVETIEADFNNETGNIAFRATFQNPDGLLRNGGTGNIFMPVKLKNAMLIPQEATFEILDKKFVYVVDDNNTVHSKQISVGVEIPHVFSVTSGISTRDRILVDGLRKVKNGQKINTRFVQLKSILNDLNQLHAE